MKIAILVFSPSGNSLTTAQLIEQSFFKRNVQVQVHDVSRCKDIASQAGLTQHLKDQINPHDVLLIGGPVYAGHLQENVKKIIKAIPLPDEKWGTLAVPFVTYGGVHSSIALKEAAALLRKRNRKNILGLKIAASHSLTKKFPFQINENKPSNEEFDVVDELTRRVVELGSRNSHEIKDVSKSFSYISFGENLLYQLFSEQMFHKIMFGERIFDHKICTGCGVCAKKCPVQIIEMRDGKAVVNENGLAKCCYCAECYSNCKLDAISWDLSKSKKYLSHMYAKNKLESPQSAVYPIQ